MCDETRFVDRHFIDVDLDPETERNIRADERNAVLDHVSGVLDLDARRSTLVSADLVAKVLRQLRPS